MKTTILTILVILMTFGIKGQVAINEDNSNPDPSAMLDVKSTDKGVLVPRLTTAQRELIPSPANGLLVFDSTTESYWFYSSGVWTELIDRENKTWSENGSDIYYNEGNVGIGISSPQFPLELGPSNVGGKKLAVDYNFAAPSFNGFGGDIFTGLTFYSGDSDNPRMVLSQFGRLGIGLSASPSDMLHVNSEPGVSPFRVQYDGATKLRVHYNGGVSIGENYLPPTDGLRVKGLLQPIGNIGTTQNLTIETSDQFSGLTLKGYTSELLMDGTGMYANSPTNIIMETTSKYNKVEMNELGFATVSEENIHIETTGVNKSITLKAGSNMVQIDSNGGITISSTGNDITINTNGDNLELNTNGGDFAIITGTGNFTVEAENIRMNAADSIDFFSFWHYASECTNGTLSFTSQNVNWDIWDTFSLSSYYTNISGELGLNLLSNNILNIDGNKVDINNGFANNKLAARLSDQTISQVSGFGPAFGLITVGSTSVFIGD